MEIHKTNTAFKGPIGGLPNPEHMRRIQAAFNCLDESMGHTPSPEERQALDKRVYGDTDTEEQKK